MTALAFVLGGLFTLLATVAGAVIALHDILKNLDSKNKSRKRHTLS
jgi:hypothetical protein